MWYDVNNVLRRGALYNWLYGARGIGKTYSIKKYMIDNFLKNGKESYYLRRYKTELQSSKMSGFFNDIQQNEMYCKYVIKHHGGKNGGYFTIDEKIFMYYGALTNQKLLSKGLSYPNVNFINFDEFVLDTSDSYHRYLPDEITSFLELYESITRLRDVTVVFTSNSLRFYNPYTTYFGLHKPQKGKIWRNGDKLVEIIYDEDFARMKHETRFGRLIGNTAYARYAIDNDFIGENDDFICAKSQKVKPFINLRVGASIYGIWCDYLIGKFWFSFDYNKTKDIYTLRSEDHTPNDVLLGTSRSFYLNEIRRVFDCGGLYFDCKKAKYAFYDTILPLLKRR